MLHGYPDQLIDRDGSVREVPRPRLRIRRPPPKDATATVRLTRRDRERLEAAAARAGLTRTEWMRRVLLDAVEAEERAHWARNRTLAAIFEEDPGDG